MIFMSSRYRFGVVSVVVLLISISSYANEPQGDVQFDKGHPQINEKVETFANAVAQAFFSDFSESQVNFQRTPEGLIVNEMGQGRLFGQYQGLLEKEGESSEVMADFSIQMGIEQERQREYEIHVGASGEISNPTLFMNNYLNQIASQCGGFRLTQRPVQQRYLCDSIAQEEDLLSDNTTAPQKAARIAGIMKQGLLSEIEAMTDRRLEPIKAEFLAFVSDNITITENPEETLIQVTMGGLASNFRDDAGLFLNDHDLIDYSYDLIEIRVSEASIQFNYHMIKYHVISAFDTAMMGLGQMQGTLENPNIGQSIGEGIRGEQGIKEAIRSNARWRDLISSVGVVGMDLLFGGEDNNSEAEEGLDSPELEELGLD